jgi:hypothetical protein
LRSDLAQSGTIEALHALIPRAIRASLRSGRNGPAKEIAMKAYEASFDVHAEQRALQDLTIGQLQQRYLELVGEVSQSRNRPYLVKRILWFEQASRHGGLSDDAKALAATLARDVDVRTTIPPHALAAPERPRPPGGDPRLPAPGRAIVRRYKGRAVRVVVQPDGFEYEGTRYSSLSAVAREVTGTHINGFRFFGLGGAKA